MNLVRYILATLLLAACTAVPSCAQTKQTPAAPHPASTATFENSEQGLNSQLQAVLTASKDPEKFKAAIGDLEIPDYEGWFDKNFAPDVQAFWAGSYRRALRGTHNFVGIFTILAHRDGVFKIRKVNGAPASRLEEVFTDKMRNPVDVFAAGWQRKNATETTGEQLLGYYFFLDGKFRWFYMLDFPKNQGATTDKGANSQAGASTGQTGGSKSPDASSATQASPPSQQK